MTAENQQIIRGILLELGIVFEEPIDAPAPRFRLLNHSLPHKVYLNIPKNTNFKLQILFEGQNQFQNLTDIYNSIQNLEQPVLINEEQEGNQYYTIYLTTINHLGINIQNNRQQISDIILFWHNQFI